MSSKSRSGVSLKITFAPYLLQEWGGEFSEEEASDWSTEIRQWQKNPDAPNFYFGKDSLNAGSKLVRHAHIAPPDDHPNYSSWCKQYERRRRQTSDGFMVYTINHHPPLGQGHGFLVLGMLWDPGAHATLGTSPNLRAMWEQWAQPFHHDGTVLGVG